jgi:cytochrome c556
MLKGLTGAQPYAEVIEWTRQPENALLANKFPDAYMFLAPQTGEFDWSAWGILKSSGFRVSKTENEMVIDMFAAQGEQQDRKLVAEYEAAIAAQDPETDEGKAAIRELEAARTAEREDVKNRNPYWATKSQTRLEPYDVESIRQQFVQTQQMMDYLRERNDGELTGSAAAIDAAMQVWLEMNVAKSMISYYTDEGKDQRAQIDRDLEYVLAEIGASDPTAANFIETILSNRSLFGRLM